MSTRAAWVSKIIKNEVKAEFPAIKFSVRSENYSGGNSVNISYDKGRNAPSVEEVEAIVKKYQAGHFDGMTDSYEYTNKTSGPTVRHVCVQAHYPQPVRQAVQAVLGNGASPQEWRRALDQELALQGL